MVSIQEYANRNRNRGVSVYSPTRPVRPQGTLANSGTARRILQRNQPAPWTGGGGGGGMARPSMAMQGSDLPSYQAPRTGLDDILDRYDSQSPAPPQQEEQDGGWRGVLGTVVNSWPAKAIMAPLNILDIPRRAVVSTVNEVADVFNGGDASWDDWFDQVRDPNFGFGSIVGSTGNKWADRFIGFAGDVLLDPMTYVAGAGVFSGTGRAARTRLASLAASEGLGEDVIRSLGRYGLSGVDNATRASLRQAATRMGEDIGEQILDRGYYLKVPFRDSFHRIPGTAKLDQAISPIFAGTRATLADTRLGTFLRNRVRTPEVMREATEKLITGRGSMAFEDAAGIYLYTNAQRRLGNTATNRFLGEAANTIKASGSRELDALIERAELEGNTVLNDLFNRASKFIQDAGINFYPRKNYIPHILTQPAVEWFRTDSKLANAFRQALIPGMDLDELSPRLMERHLTAGTVAEIGLEGEKRTFNAGRGTIADINAEFARVFPELKFKLFDDHIDTIAAVYGRHLGDDIGRAGGLKALLNSKSRLVRLASDEGMVKTLIDEEALDLLNKQTADMLRADHRALTDRITKLREKQVEGTQALQGVVGLHMRETIDELENLEPQLKEELDHLFAQEASLSQAAGRTSALTGDAPASNVGQLEVKLTDAYQRLEQRAMAADKRLADLQQNAARENAAWQSLQQMAGSDPGMMTVPERFQALRQWNIAAAEAASLAMDREAVSTLRTQLAELTRKADLAEALAEDPAAVGLRAGLPVLPEERIGAGVRLGPDGEILEYVGPTSGPRGAREAVEEEMYQTELEDWRREVRAWEAGGKQGRKPVKPKRERRLTVATGRVRWSQSDEVHDIVTFANKERQRAIRAVENQVPDDVSFNLHELNQRVLNKQSQLADDERRLSHMAEIHRDNIDRAEQRVEAAINMDKELRRRERDLWGADEAEQRAARLETQRHQDGELHAAKQDFAEAQTPVSRARERRNQTRAQLEEAKNYLASNQFIPPEAGAAIRRANNAEARLLRDAETRIPRAKTEWRIFPEIDAPPRAGAYTFEQRDRLAQLYEVVRNTHPVDKAGAGGSYMVRQARETIARIGEQGGPRGPRDASALVEAQRVLGDYRMGRMNTAAHQRYRAAIAEINAIERAVTESPTYAAQEFGEVRRIGGMLDRLEELRTPLPVPGKGTKRYKALAASPRAPGGARDVIGMAKENHDLAGDWLDNYATDLIDTGVIEDTHREYIAGLRDELKKWVDLYTRPKDYRRTPDVQSEIRRASNDLGRLVDVMLSAQASIAAGYEPTPQLMTAIAAHRFLRERRRLDDSVTELERLLRISPEDRIATFRRTIDNYETKIAEEQKIIDNPLTDEAERARAINRRNNARRQLGKKLDAGVVQPGEGDMRGVIEDDIDSMTDMIMSHLDEFDEASSDLRKMKNWRDVYTRPVEKRAELESNVGRYELEIAEIEFSQRRLQTAVTRARNAGRATVGYTPTESSTFEKTVSEAERMIEAGEVPDKLVPAVRSKVEVAKRRQAPGAAERTVSWSQVGRAKKTTQMSLDEAEAELARFPRYLETKRAAQHKNQMQLETMLGRSQNRIAELERLLTDAEAPLNDPGIRALKARAREIDMQARRRPGRTLAEKRLPEEQAELDQIAARIEQSTSPPDPERITAMQAELAERKGYRDEYERSMAYDYELMGHAEDNGYRMLRDLTQNLRAPTKQEAQLMRSILGGEQGKQAEAILGALDDFIGDRSMMSDQAVRDAITMIRDLASSRRIDDDALDRILPPDELGRALDFEELTRVAQASADVDMVLSGAGRQTARTVNAEGFREDFFNLLIEQAQRRRQEAEQEIKHFTGWLDMAINEDVVSTIGIVNKYFGGKLRDFTKKERAAMRAANQPIPNLVTRRRKVIREAIAEAMQAKGYDPGLSLERRLREAKTLRSRLNIAIRGLGMVLAEPGGDMDEILRWWDNAARGDLGTVTSLAELTNTLRAPDEITMLAKARRSQLQREINAATKRGDAEAADALSAELATINQGRYLPTEAQLAEPPPVRRPAEPSEAAISGTNETPDLEELTQLRTQLAGLEPRYLQLDHEVASQNEQLRALQQTIDQANRPVPTTGVTTESVIRELEQLAAQERKALPAGKTSWADLHLAMARSAAFADSLPDEITAEMEAQLDELTNQVMRARENLVDYKPTRQRAEKIAAKMPLGGETTVVDPDAQAAMIEQATQLRRSINAAQSELDDLSGQRGALQARIDELDHAHAARETTDPSLETPSMVEDPIGAAQAEGLPSEGMSPETAPTHLVEDSIWDGDASPEDLAREYDTVVAQSRALLKQYGSYRNMPPDARRSAGELANRAELIAKKREETFAAATKGFSESDETRLLAATESAAQAANPRIDMDWWTVISTGTPPSHVSTEIMRHPGGGYNRRGVMRNQMRTGIERGKLRGRGGSMYRGSLSAREEVLAGRHEPRLRVKKRNPATGRMRLEPITDRPLSRFERRARMVEPYRNAERDLRGITERARAAAEPLGEEIAAREGEIAAREEGFAAATAEFADQAVAARAENMRAQQLRLNHANDAVAQGQRHVRRIEGQRERINDAYSRALAAQDIQLGEVRKRAIETQIDHEAAARELELYRAAMRDPTKKSNRNLRQIWSDVQDLMEFKRGAQPIALFPPGTNLADMPLELSSVPEVRQIEALLSAALHQQELIDELDLHGNVIAKRLKDFERAPKKSAFFTPEQMLAMPKGQAERFEDVFVHQVADGWQSVAEDMFTGPDALVIANSLQTAMDNIRRTIREPGFWKAIEKYTAFFSTYATARPGFHVRNAMSGTFMNMVDGVRLRHMRRAPGIWHDFVRDPAAFWARTGPEAEMQKLALTAVFGSGAGGQFSERGLTEMATTAGGKLYQGVMNNFITRMNRKAGAYVEGPMRLAMALDSLSKGMSVDAALDRITKFHFDYTQLSELDVVARRMIPFWTFMSRNLPLQIESMWLRPRTYLQYQSVVRNFGEQVDPLTPDYWLSQGAFTLDENAAEGKGEPWYLAPDLPHLRVAEPLTALSQGDLGKAFLSDVNPLFLAPLEAYAAGKKMYTGAPIDDQLRAPEGAGEALLSLLPMLGTTAASGQRLVDPRAMHVANSVLPPIELLNRLIPNEEAGPTTRVGRQGETWARTFGAPVYKLTEGVQRNTIRTRRNERTRERDRQATLARN